MQAYGGVEVEPHTFLTSAVDGNEWSAWSLGRFPSGETPETYWIGGLVSPRVGLDTVAKERNPSINPAWNRSPVVQPVA
jgi:hypothetical protein